MAYNRTRAAKLLTAAELELFNASLARDAGKLSEKQLKAKVKRSRALAMVVTASTDMPSDPSVIHAATSDTRGARIRRPTAAPASAATATPATSNASTALRLTVPQR